MDNSSEYVIDSKINLLKTKYEYCNPHEKKEVSDKMINFLDKWKKNNIKYIILHPGMINMKNNVDATIFYFKNAFKHCGDENKNIMRDKIIELLQSN